MIDEEFLNKIYYKKQEDVENRISHEYHKRIKEIKTNEKEEKENIKMGIISELYYKEGFKDGVDFIINYIEKNK